LEPGSRLASRLLAVTSRRLSSIDVLLLLMTLIWGTNFSIVKTALVVMDAQAFNAVRMVIASALFLIVIVAVRRRPQVLRGSMASIFFTPEPITRRDWIALGGLGLIGHAAYQYFFIGGLARTSVANSSLMLAATPVVIALISAGLGHERISRVHWLGAGLSMAGIYLVVAQAPPSGDSSLTGDLMMLGAVICWAIYTLGTRQLMLRHSPVGVTGFSMGIGTLLYIPLTIPHLLRTDWARVTPAAWTALVYSAIFALCVAYTIWYMAVREIGSARTSVYSNVVPIVAMLTAVVFLGERMTAGRVAGAAAVLVGVALTRAGKAAPLVPPQD
jgi:drug/metabolite transporter (DMT)-like permease